MGLDMDMKIAAKRAMNGQRGFTLIEVIIAASIMIILSIGLLGVFSNVVQRNRGENTRMQALSVLQEEVEYYRSLKFIPVGSHGALDAGTYNKTGARAGADGRVFNIVVVITNVDGILDPNSKFKQIVITASLPTGAETGWLEDLRTNVTIQRVRSN